MKRVKQVPTTKFNPVLLTLAREARRLTQEELAERASLSQPEVSRYELGHREPSDEHIDRIANALGYTRSLFYQPYEPCGLGSNGLYHRKQRSLSTKDANALIAQMNILRFFAERLLKSVDIDHVRTIPQYPSVDHNGDTEAIAEMVRAAWRLPAGPVRDLVGVLENVGCIIHRTDFETTKLDAWGYWNHPSPPIIFMNDTAPMDRVRFTVAHELGHFVMHALPNETQEEEADAFASAFLMPSRDILPDLKRERITLPYLAQLKPYWRVSIAALIRRARDLEVISVRQYRSLYTELSALGYRQQEPITISPEKPTLLQDIIKAHLEDLHYSMADIAELAMLSQEEFEQEYMDQRPMLRLVSPPKKHTIAR